jgi:formylglycine-generating enzyme
MGLVIALLVGIICSVIGHQMNVAKNRPVSEAWFACMLLGPIGLLILALAPKQPSLSYRTQNPFAREQRPINPGDVVAEALGGLSNASEGEAGDPFDFRRPTAETSGTPPASDPPPSRGGPNSNRPRQTSRDDDSAGSTPNSPPPTTPAIRGSEYDAGHPRRTRPRGVDRRSADPRPRPRKRMVRWLVLLVIGAVAVGAGLYLLDGNRDKLNRAKSQSNLRHIGLAIHDYNDTHGELPSNTYSPDGQPLLSWRVHLLPFLEQDALYSQFKLAEPWDSPNNIRLLDKIPRIYAAPNGPRDHSFMTYYRGFSSSGAVFERKCVLGQPRPDTDHLSIEMIDNTSKTILVVEAGDPIEWTKPEDLDASADKPFPKIGGFQWRGGVCEALLADGLVYQFNSTTPESTLRAMVRHNARPLPARPQTEPREPSSGSSRERTAPAAQTSEDAAVSQIIRRLIPRAAGSPRDEVGRVRGDGKVGSPDDRTLTALLLLYMKLPNPDDVADRATRAAEEQDWKYLESPPDVVKLIQAVSKTKDAQTWTVIQPEYIVDLTCRVTGDLASGTVHFRAAGIYQGRAEYIANRTDGNWRIDEFRLPGYGVKIALKSNGKWHLTSTNGVSDLLPPAKPGEVIDVEIAPGVKMPFCWIPAGKTQLGSSQTERDFIVKTVPGPPSHLEDESEQRRGAFSTNGFWLAKYPVTQEQYRAIMGRNPSTFLPTNERLRRDGITDTKSFPVEQITWTNAKSFIKRLNDSLGTAWQMRNVSFTLPHEDEWEYACRGGLGNRRAFYFGPALDGRAANCNGSVPFGANEKGPFVGHPTPVGAYEKAAPHPWGLCDMTGNVYQWCENLYDPVRDPTNRALRGGCWGQSALNCRSASRARGMPDGRGVSDLGFRVCVHVD